MQEINKGDTLDALFKATMIFMVTYNQEGIDR